MAKKHTGSYYKERASALNTATKETGAVFYVLASPNADSYKTQEIGGFKCVSCTTEFASTKSEGFAPFCVNCGSEDVKAHDVKVQAVAEDNALSGIQCPTKACASLNIVSDETATTLKGEVCCASCGTHINYEIAEQDASKEFDEADKFQKEKMAGDKAENKESAEDVTDTEEVEDKDDKDEETSDSDDDFGGDDIGNDDEEMMDEDEDVDESCMEMSMLKIALASKQRSVDIVNVGAAVYAMVNGSTVASLNFEKAGDNKSVFYTKAFLDSIAAKVNNIGLEKALANFGFQEIKVAFPLAKTIEENATVKAEAAVKSYKERLATLSADMTQCLSIAATGLNKGFYRNEGNPLKAAFYAELEAAGVRSPAKIIDKIFAAAGDDWNKAMITKAMDLLSKTVEVRNELAEAITGSAYQLADAEEADGEGGESGEAGEILENASYEATATGTDGVVKIKAIRDKHKRLFNRQ